MTQTIPRGDVLVALMGTPHISDMTTSALRLTQALLDRGAQVQLWTCGYATMLTQRSLGENKPRNLVDWSGNYPSTAALAQEMLAAALDQLRWYACRFCSEERGATAHIPEVRLRPPFKFAEHIKACDTSLFLGVC